MQNNPNRVAVIGRRFGGLLEFSRQLNDLNIFHITLRKSSIEIVKMLEAGERFDTLVFDNFEIPRDSDCLRSIAWYRAVDLIILTADVNFQQRREILEWAKKRSLPPLRVLPLPVRADDFKQVMTTPTTAQQKAIFRQTGHQ
ncbi:hypothetical protein ACX64L_14945 [Pseudomonas monsensis]